MAQIRIISYSLNGRWMAPVMRQLALLRWIRRYSSYLGINCECWIITASDADPIARKEGIPAIALPSRERVRESADDEVRYLATAKVWIRNIVSSLSPDIMIVDGHPSGSMRELAHALEFAKHKSLITPSQYITGDIDTPTAGSIMSHYNQITKPTTNSPILIREREELLPRHEARSSLGILRERVVSITLRGGESKENQAALKREIDKIIANDWHAVICAGPGYRGAALRGPHRTWVGSHLPMELLPGIDVAVSPGGYHSFYELMYAGIPTVFLPQMRHDQESSRLFMKAEMAGAGRVARNVNQISALIEDAGSPRAARILAPRNGAREIAAKILSMVVPKEDVDAASDAVSPTLLGTFRRFKATPEEHWRLLKLLGGETPSQWQKKRQAAEDLRSVGIDTPELPASPPRPLGLIQRFLVLCETIELPLDQGIAIAQIIDAKFPNAHSEVIVQSVEQVLPEMARFDEWHIANRLLHNLKIQRGYRLEEFSRSLVSWLKGKAQLSSAVKDFQRAIDQGKSIADALTADVVDS